MKTLTYISTENVNELTWPAVTDNSNLYSPALSVFTDFMSAGPRVIEANTPADELVHLMKKEHVRMKLVVDSKNQFIGVISLEDLSEDAFIKKVAEKYKRSDLLVADLMRPKDEVLALSYSSLKKADIESLLMSQKDNKYQHLLVMDEESKTIRGVISCNDIVRQLRLSMDITRSSFAGVYAKTILGVDGEIKRLKVA